MQVNLNKFQTELIKLSLSEAELSISLIVITVLAIVRPHEWASNLLPTGSTQVKTNKIPIKSSSKFTTFCITSFPTKRINFGDISILTSCITKITNF